MITQLDEVLSRLTKLPPKELEALQRIHEDVRSKQIWIPNPGPQTDAYLNEADEILFGGEAGGGKALSLDTPIPTMHGWSTMGELQVGDKVFDESGHPCTVIAKSRVITEPAYRITFSDGSEIIADPRHQWVTSTYLERMRRLRSSQEWLATRRLNREKRGTGKKPWLAERNAMQAHGRNLPYSAIRTTEQIASSLRIKQRVNHSISVCGALEIPDADLLIDPYVLGAWIGDGSSHGGSITGIDNEVFQNIANAGYTISARSSPVTPGILGLQKQLRILGLLGNKHIPPAYLRSSRDQRLSLLQGLMDTDGYCDTRGQCEFTTTNRRVADDAHELISSLGIKVSIREGDAKLNGRVISKKYRLKLITELPAFRLSRKLIRQKRSGFRGTHDRRYIVSCEQVDPVPMQCIQVDSPNKMYLCGRSMIPTHNSDLLIGLSLTAHERSLILRRTNKESEKLVDRYMEIMQTRNGYNGQEKTWRTTDGRIIDIAGCQHEHDKQKWKGIAHDLKGFDELVDFTETQYNFIITWNRSTKQGQRCRIVATSNPPTRPEGMWVVRRWAPWLDPKHPNPAKPGELRWFTTVNGKDTEVDGRGPHLIDGKEVFAKSRTFIRSRLSDNPDLSRTDYGSRLDALPEELRVAYREGKFDASIKDAPFQCIPTDWIRHAMERWEERPRPGVPMCAMGVDASGGGNDPMIIAPRYDGWYMPMIEIPAKELPVERMGKVSCGHIISHRRDKAIVVVDMGGGYGGPIYEHLKENDIDCIGFKGAESSVKRTQDKLLRFTNKRTEAYWKFREALDPSQVNGSPIFLPDDQQLLAELAAPVFELTPNGIKLEPKEDVMERLGRSPDRADAVVMAWFGGPNYLTDGNTWREKASRRGQAPQVVMGRSHARRR